MKNLLFAIASFSACIAFADIRLPEYGQVSGVSNQVKVVDGKVDAIAAQIGVFPTVKFTEPPVGESQARINFVINSGDGAYIPSQAVQEQLLVGAKIFLTVGNNTTHYEIKSLQPNTSISTAVSVSGNANATVSVSFGAADEVVLITKQQAKISEGHSYTIALNCHKAVSAYRQIGRLQIIGANSTAKSYLIVRDSDGNGDVQTKFGYYTDQLGTEWFDETGFMNDVRICKVEDGQLKWGWNSVDNPNGACTWESQFPWNGFRNIDVVLTSASGGTGQNTYKFVEFPIYYVRFDENVTIPFVYKYTSGGSQICTTNNTPCRIWWVCETQLDGYVLPPWEKVWQTYYDTNTTTIVRTGVPKIKNYYARYKSVDKTKTINSATVSVLQSYPWGATVTGGTRNEDNNRAHALNGCSITVDGVSYGPDATERRFALTGWNDYMSVAFLTYIHLGPDVQGWIYGNCGTTSIAQSRQDCLEDVFGYNPGFSTFAIGDTAQSQAPFSYFGIVNLWGSEGDQMADATMFNQRLADNSECVFAMVQLDRSKYTPHETDLNTLSGLGYERLTFNTKMTGFTSTNYRGLDSRQDYWGFWITDCKPDSIAMVSAGVDATWLGSTPAVGTVASNPYMCSLSANRDRARPLGAWSVYASFAPAYAAAGSWGARLSMVIPAAQ